MCVKVVITALTLASIQFSIVRTHFKGYIIYAQSSVYQEEFKKKNPEKRAVFPQREARQSEFRVGPTALAPNS